MNILQWNANGFYTRYERLQLLCQNHKPEIICIQETNFKANSKGKLKGFKCYNKNRHYSNIASGGVAIFAKEYLPAEQIDIQTEIEAVAIKIQAPATISVCNIYLPNSQSLDANEIKDLIKQLPKPFILLGDFNSHNTIWGSNKSDTRGRQMENIIDEEDLIILNNGQPTHFNMSNGRLSAIDLTLCSTAIAPKCNWGVLEQLHDSDHFPILLYVDCPHSIPDSFARSLKWNYDKANWEQYKKCISKLLNQQDIFEENDDIDRIIQTFSNVITIATYESIKYTRPTNKTRSVPWWNDECGDAIKRSKRAFNKYKKHNTLENKIEYKKMRAKARRIIKESKAKSWTVFVSSISASNNIKDSWNKINAIKGSKLYNSIPFLQNDNKMITEPYCIANILADKFTKNSSSQNYTADFLQYKAEEEKEEITFNSNQDTGSQYHLNNPISLKELTSTIDSTKNSSPGPDGIPNILIKQLPTEGIETLLKIYNLIWTKNIFPKVWKTAIVVPIPKPGKDRSKSENYRPIALTCNMCKIFEKIINSRLRWFLDFQKIISNNQFGFRSNHSTLAHLISIHTHIQEAFSNNQHVLAINLDIEKAYDMVWIHGILRKLQQIGIGGHMFQFIKSLMKDRTIQVRINGCLSEEMKIENGVPQGSVLSVTLFLLAINDVDANIEAPVFTRKYADDITVFCKGKSISSSQQIMQASLNRLHEWTQRTGFKFSAQKTECILFAKHNEENLPTLRLGDHNLKYVERTKILGMHFDAKMSWKSHIQILSDECKKRLNILKCLSHNNWGADKNLLLLTYKTTVRAKLDYGSIIYDSARWNDLKKLEVIHNQGLRISTGCYRTSPIGSILIESNEPNLAHRRNTLMLKYAINAAASINPIILHDVYPVIQAEYKEKSRYIPYMQKLKHLCKK